MTTALGITSFSAIVIITYLLGFIWKTTDKLPDKWIPVVCSVSGCVLGIMSYIIKVPEFPANDIVTAAAVGIVSGFAATGINQVYKQLVKSNSKSDGFTETPSSEDEDKADSEKQADE